MMPRNSTKAGTVDSKSSKPVSMKFEIFEEEKGEKLIYPSNLFETMDDRQFQSLSPRSQEINSMIRAIKKSFTTYKEPPVTTTDFYKIGKMLGRGAFGKVSLGMHKLA